MTIDTTRTLRADTDIPAWQRVRWGAVFAGLVIALVTQMLLTVLGLAVGLTAVDPRQGAPGEALGWGAAVWGVVSLLVSLFVGGYVAGRLAGVLRSGDGAMNGVLVWALSLLGAVWLASMGISSLLSTSFSLVAGLSQASGPVVAQSGTGRQVTAQVEQQAQQAKESVERLGQSGTAESQQARETAARAADYGATGAWLLLVAALLGLAVAAWGGATGTRDAVRLSTRAV